MLLVADQAMLLAYDVNNKLVFYNLTGQFRSIGTDKLIIDGSTGRNYILYLALPLQIAAGNRIVCILENGSLNK